MRIGHFTPSYTPITPGHIAQLLREEATIHDRLGFEYQWWSEECSDICVVRNRALARAIDEGLDYLCMQDSDIFSKSSLGAIAPMLSTAKETGAAMVAAICGLRREPIRSNVEPSRPGEVYEAIKVGTGLVLIDCRQVAAAIEADNTDRCFDKLYNEDGTAIEVGEDIWFSRWLRNQGLTIFVDGRVPTTHARKDISTLDYPGARQATSQTPSGTPAETTGAQ